MTLALKHSAIFLVYLLAQVFIFNHFTLYDTATPYVFLVAFLLLPPNVPFAAQVTLAFVGGLMADLFSFDAFRGLHAFSLVLMMSLRNIWMEIITNRATYHGNEENLIAAQPPVWYVQYFIPLIFIHHLAYYVLEVFSFGAFHITLLKTTTSTLFTFLIAFILTMILHRSNKR